MKRKIMVVMALLVASMAMGGEESGLLRIEESQAQKPELVIQNGHSATVYSVSFSPDGKTLASGSGDTTIKFWEVSSGKLLCTLLPLDKEDWIHYTPEGYFDVSEGGKKYIGWTVGMEAYPAEKFWDQYYRPGLFGEVMRGKEIK